MNPNHYLAVAIQYLLTHRPNWRQDVIVGKTLVSSSMIDTSSIGWDVGFPRCPWVSNGLCRDWSMDRSVLAEKKAPEQASFATMGARGQRIKMDSSWCCSPLRLPRRREGPGEHYRELTAEFGTPHYTRIDAPATAEQKAKLQETDARCCKESELAGEPITAKLTKAPGNQAPIGGLKVIAQSGWFAARPSGTENIYKIYAESFKSETHLHAI
jgi:phosphoglucomutase